MAFNGKLIRVADQNGKWGVLIDTEEKGETWLTIWDRKFAGQDSAEHKAVCDCHDFVGERVVFEATRGNLKDKGGDEEGERWNATITAIALESVSELPNWTEGIEPPTPPEIEREAPVVDSPSNPEQVVAKYNTERLSRLALEAVQADLRAHEARAAWLDEVTRLAS